MDGDPQEGRIGYWRLCAPDYPDLYSHSFPSRAAAEHHRDLMHRPDLEVWGYTLDGVLAFRPEPST